MNNKPPIKTCFSRACVCYNIFTCKRKEFKSISALAAYIEKSTANTGKIMRSGMHTGDWIVAYLEDEKKAIEKLRVFQRKEKFKLKSSRSEKLVSLRIDAKTTILVTEDKATPEYAAKWKERHEQDAKHAFAQEFINANDSMNLNKKKGGRK